MTSQDYIALLPPILMALFGCATLLLDAYLVFFNLIGELLIGFSLLRQWQVLSDSGVLQKAVMIDGLSLFANALIWLATVGTLLISYRYLKSDQQDRGEYYSLALFAQCGMYFMATATELITLFIGLELTAISFYILVGFMRADRRSNEAALKYLLLGALSSGFVLYGFSLLYGVSGDTGFAEIAASVARQGARDPFVILATIAVTVGLLFKISAAPFHTWAPDAYDGAPTPITGFLSVASKIASFAVLIRLLWLTLGDARSIWQPILAVAAVLSLTIGSIAAITQTRIKRLFAYSSIAHAGYILLGFLTNTPKGLQAIYIYLLVYAVMNLGAFAVLASLHRKGIEGAELADLRGLSHSHPTHAALFAILLLSLAGMPPTAGFLGKYFIFAALIQTSHFVLAAVAAAYVAVSLFIYFRLVREMYILGVETREPLAASIGVRALLFATAALTLIIGLYPQPVLQAALPLAGIGR